MTKAMTDAMMRAGCTVRRVLRWLAIAGFAVLTSHVHAAAQAPSPAAAFGALPQMTDVAISPGGSAIAYIARTPAGVAVVLQSLTDGRDVVTPFAGGKVRDVAWATDDVAIVTASVSIESTRGNTKGVYELWRSIAIDAKTGKRVFLTPGRDTAVNLDYTVDAIAKDGSGDALMTTYEFAVGAYREQTGTRLASANPMRDAFRLVSYRVNVRTGESRRVGEGDVKSISVLLRGDGDIAARMDLNPDDKSFAIVARDGLGWKRVFEAKDVVRPPLRFAGTSADADRVYVLDQRGEQGALKLLDLKTGALAPAPIAAGSVDDLVMDQFANQPVAVVQDGLQSKTTWLDPKLADIAAKARRAFNGKIVRLASWTQDRSKVILRVSAGDMPPVWYLLDAGSMRAEIVGEERPVLAGRTFGPKTLIDYPARDGAAIPAFLTVPPAPPGAAPRGLPLVLLPHGGPEAHDTEDFDWWAQFLAAQGYAVLQPQYRGSSGLGAAWADAGRGEWGRRMQDDLTDGVKAMIARGLADPRRVCIVGASYGGYAALAGAAFTPDLYACAASINGVSDLNAMLGDLKKRAGGTSTALNYWIEHFGDRSSAELAAVSPVTAAARMQARLLLIHGRDDTVVSIDQTRAMALALKRAGKEASLIELPGEDHWLSGAATRTRTLDEIDALLRQTIGKPSAP